MTPEPTLIPRVVGTMGGKSIRAVVVSDPGAGPVPYIVWRDVLEVFGMEGFEFACAHIETNRIARLPEGARVLTLPALVRGAVASMVEAGASPAETRRELEVILNSGLRALLDWPRHA